MSVPMVKSCCFCATLHTGTLIIGYMYTSLGHSAQRIKFKICLTLVLAGSLVVILALLTTRCQANPMHTNWLCVDTDHGLQYGLLVTLAPLGRNGTVSTHKSALYVTAAVVSGLQLVSSLLLIVAAYKKLPFLTLPWTIVTGILTAIFFVMCLTGISLILQDTGELLEVESFIIFLHLARACISVYCILVVHSRHKQIMYEENEERFQRSGKLYHAVSVREQAV